MSDRTISIEIEKYRQDPASRQWELPPWGHPLSQGVLPLCITYEDHLFPIGTAFTIGRSVSFVVSAMHNVREAWKFEERLNYLLHADELPKSVDLKHAGLAVIYQRQLENGTIDLTVWPLETAEGAPPTDVIFGSLQFQAGLPTLVQRLSFDLPSIGEKVWSIGYAGFEFPKDGIPLADVQAGKFDWKNQYRHRLVVVEGFVERIFTRKFAAGYVEGACFTFDADIAHAQSGGPVLSLDGTVRGVNSAGAASYFNRPASIASLFYPLLLINLRFGAQLGPVRLNASRPMVDLIAQGAITTDGSEERVGICRDEVTGSLVVNPRGAPDAAEYAHDDFRAFQEGRTATKETRPGYRLRKVDPQDEAASTGTPSPDSQKGPEDQ